ncbi:hypothetical protein ACHAPE_003527 [Trichoderma viride]
MEDWLNESGAAGLDNLELAEFALTGRGRFPSWASPSLYAAPLSVEDAVAVYLLFVRSREHGYDGLRSHVAAMPARYSSSIFFKEDELEVCAGTSLYTLTKQLEERIEDDYRVLVMRVFAQHPDLFPLAKFSIQNVGIMSE